jgi:GNAT superfamily N-acetyltransferase
VEVRAAVVGDADRIAALNAAGWRAGFRGLISDAYLTAYDGLPRLRHETLAELGDDDIQLVAVDGEDLVGWVAGGPAHEDDLGPGAYEVRACYVDPARWRTGVGRWLMAALIDRLDPGALDSPGAVDRARCGPDQRVLRLARDGATAGRRCSTGAVQCRWSASPSCSSACGPTHRRPQSPEGPMDESADEPGSRNPGGPTLSVPACDLRPRISESSRVDRRQ